MSLKCSTDCLTLDDLFGSPVAKAILFVPGHYPRSVIPGVLRTVNVTTQKDLRENSISCFYKQFFPVHRLVFFFFLSQILSGIHNPARCGASTCGCSNEMIYHFWELLEVQMRYEALKAADMLNGSGISVWEMAAGITLFSEGWIGIQRR